MRTVIDIHSRQEITQNPILEEQGKRIIEYLMQYVQVPTEGAHNSDETIIEFLIKTIENNSNASKEQIIFDRIHGRAGA